MQPEQTSDPTRAPWSVAFAGAARAAFGMIWAIDAYLAWRPELAAHYEGYLQNASRGQPGWLHGWFAMWLAVVAWSPATFVWMTRLIETAIALALIAGL